MKMIKFESFEEFNKVFIQSMKNYINFRDFLLVLNRHLNFISGKKNVVNF
jgi:hypothetical protein